MKIETYLDIQKEQFENYLMQTIKKELNELSIDTQTLEGSCFKKQLSSQFHDRYPVIVEIITFKPGKYHARITHHTKSHDLIYRYEQEENLKVSYEEIYDSSSMLEKLNYHLVVFISQKIYKKRMLAHLKMIESNILSSIKTVSNEH